MDIIRLLSLGQILDWTSLSSGRSTARTKGRNWPTAVRCGRPNPTQYRWIVDPTPHLRRLSRHSGRSLFRHGQAEEEIGSRTLLKAHVCQRRWSGARATLNALAGFNRRALIVRERLIPTAGAAAALALMLDVGWYSGTDFFHRNSDSAFWMLEALLAALWAYLALRVKFRPAASTIGLCNMRVAWTVLTFFTVLAENWYRGIDLLSRGHDQAFALIGAAAFAALCWTFPLWTPIFPEKDKSS